MNTNRAVVAKFKNRYGETKTIHHTSHGLRVRFDSPTPFLRLAPALASYIGERIRAKRVEFGLTLSELALRAGMTGGKNRMYAIEKATRLGGVRLGTLYAIAAAFGCEVAEFLPSVADMMREANIETSTALRLVRP